MPSVISNSSFFDFSFRSPKRASPICIDGDLEDWGTQYLVPDLMHLRGRTPFAQVYFTWDDDSLYVGLLVPGKKRPVEVAYGRPWQRDVLEVWIDLRNDKTRRRYSEHCHHFFLLPRGRKGNEGLATATEWREPGSSIQETLFDHKEIEIASVIGRQKYSLEARIGRGAIPTYDPVEHPVIGFNYHLNDVGREPQWWSCGSDFLRHLDPSTWGSAELVE